MQHQPLDDLEMFAVLRAAYPEKFPNDDAETFDEAQHFADELDGWEEISDLLGRVAMLTMPLQSPLSNKFSHCLGPVRAAGGLFNLEAAVKRDAAV